MSALDSGGTLADMEIRQGYASALRRELAALNREWARGRPHVESHSSDPVVVYEPSEDGAHGNFFSASYAAILSRKDWVKRLNKVHTKGKDLPRAESGRKWRELDSCMSSDALLMNIFCAPEVLNSSAVPLLLGVCAAQSPVFGWKAKVPLKSGLFDRTEVDMRWGDLLVEAKLTESDFQNRAAYIVEAYRDLDQVFDREALPKIEAITVRRKQPVEFAEEFSQEWEDTTGLTPEDASLVAREYQAGILSQAEQKSPREVQYLSYQLIRNVLAAEASSARFCVILDERRPDLKEAWFRIMAAVKSAEVRTRCLVLTWQELAAVLPTNLKSFLEYKYGIGPST